MPLRRRETIPNSALGFTVGFRTRVLPGLAARLIASCLAVGILAVFLVAMGADPWVGLRGIVRGSVGSTSALGQTLLVATPLILTGLAAAIPFSAQAFNIGGEGQLLVGGAAAAVLILVAPGLQAPMLLPAAMVAGIGGGVIWALVAGVLRVVAHANEVIVTLMMNFVAASLVAFVISSWPDPVAPQTRPLSDDAVLPRITALAPANVGILIAMAVAVAAFVVMFRTPLGLRIRATGANRDAARGRGINVGLVLITALAIGGGCAGLAGAIEVVGTRHALGSDIGQTYGYIGIAIALVSGLHPLYITLSAFLFAAITVGSNTLPATTGVSASTSLVFLASFILILLALGAIRVAGATAR